MDGLLRAKATLLKTGLWEEGLWSEDEAAVLAH